MSGGLSTSDIVGIAVGVPSGVLALLSTVIAFCAWKFPKSPPGRIGTAVRDWVVSGRGGDARGGDARGSKKARAGDAHAGDATVRIATGGIAKGGTGRGGDAEGEDATGGTAFGGNASAV